jgi:hypothetical protein
MKLTRENRSTRGKTCPSATLSTTNPTWTDPGSNPGLRGERPATNRLSHGTACTVNYGKRMCERWRCTARGLTSMRSGDENEDVDWRKAEHSNTVELLLDPTIGFVSHLYTFTGQTVYLKHLLRTQTGRQGADCWTVVNSNKLQWFGNFRQLASPSDLQTKTPWKWPPIFRRIICFVFQAVTVLANTSSTSVIGQVKKWCLLAFVWPVVLGNKSPQREKLKKSHKASSRKVSSPT